MRRWFLHPISVRHSCWRFLCSRFLLTAACRNASNPCSLQSSQNRGLPSICSHVAAKDFPLSIHAMTEQIGEHMTMHCRCLVCTLKGPQLLQSHNLQPWPSLPSWCSILSRPSEQLHPQIVLASLCAMEEYWTNLLQRLSQKWCWMLNTGCWMLDTGC